MENIYQNPVAQRVNNGTISSHVNLCASCRYCTERQSAMSGKVVNLCEANYSRPFMLTEPIGRCNRFLDKTKPTLSEMSDIAWIMESKPKGRIGFLSPEEMAQRKQQAGNAPTPPSIGF